jgi:general secretion pathway protein G
LNKEENKMNRKGFTLIELMLVIIVIGILSAMFVPKFGGRAEQSRIVAARADIKSNIAVALDLFEMDNGFYPTTEQGLSALATAPGTPPVASNWRGPYLKRTDTPTDPWGNSYVYSCPGAHNTASYDFYSLGPDKTEGTDDDITNWTK